MSSLKRHLERRDSLRTTRSGDGGLTVCEILTESLDEAIGGLISPLPDNVAIVAIGGYGRGELSLFSDIDVMLLHSVDDPSELAASLFRPLWDASLRVGHSVRTLEEAASVAKERFETQTTLLTARLIAGDEDLFDRLMDRVLAVTRARPLRRHLVAEERARRIVTPHLLMAPDVKTGRGGLRTLHGFEWERRREELIGRFSVERVDEEEEARETLIKVRNGLHAVTGRSHDVFSPELREPVARWLGGEVFTTAQALVSAMQNVDRLATRRWPEVIGPKSRGILSRLSAKPPVSSGTAVPDLEELVWLLETGEKGRQSFERLWERGLLEEVLPEWGVVRSLPQLAPFHEHPVASHLWRTIEEMHSLIADGGLYGRVAAELGKPDVLALASFLHDIGKGHGGDHCVVGAEIAKTFCERMRIPADRALLIVGAVRHHLLLVQTATRRDLDDPMVIDEIVETVGSLPLLQVLYLVTVADSKATGPTMWNSWKATLVRTLFYRCADHFGADRPADGGTTRQEVMATVALERVAELIAHLDGMPEEYLRSTTALDVLWHLDLVAELDGVSSVGVRTGEPAGLAVVIGRDRPGFRRHIAEAFAANGIDVLEARLFSRDDGVVVDSYRVRDDRTGAQVDASRWDSLRDDVEAGLLGDLDTGSKVAARAAAYHEPEGAPPVVGGSLDAASGDLVVTVKCADRIGRLAEILGVLSDCGLDIRLAKIESRGGEVVDTFHARGDLGAIEDIETRITDALTA